MSGGSKVGGSETWKAVMVIGPEPSRKGCLLARERVAAGSARCATKGVLKNPLLALRAALETHVSSRPLVW